MSDNNITTKKDEGNIIHIRGRIDAVMVEKVVPRLIALEQEDSDQTVVIVIDSEGGYVYSALAIYDVMKSVKNQIRTVCVGKAMSAAAVLLAAGTKGIRFIGRHATVLVHEVSSGTWGTISQIEVDVEEARRLKDLLVDVLTKETGQRKAIIRKLMRDSHDNFMTPKVAIELGLADMILPYRRNARP